MAEVRAQVRRRTMCDSRAVATDGVGAGTALVVGSSSSIGTAIAAELGSLGHDLLLWGRDAARLAATADRCRATDRSVSVERVDVSDRTELAAAADRAAAAASLRVVVWAAGLFDWAPADAADPSTWDQVLDVNLAAAAALTPRVLPALVANAPSALVYLGSGASRQAFPGNAAYVASKHGLAGLAGAVFLDVRDRGVKVSLVSPGPVAAGASLRSPAGQRPERLLRPDDVAAAVRFVVTFPATGCPTEVVVHPQLEP